MKRVLGVVALVSPFAVEVARFGWVRGNEWFDAWFVAQIEKAWRPGPDNRW